MAVGHDRKLPDGMMVEGLIVSNWQVVMSLCRLSQVP